MDDQQRRRHERLTRVQNCGVNLAPPLPADSPGGRALTAITNIIQEIEETDAERVTRRSDARQGTGQRKEARDQLYIQLRAIRDTARAIGVDHAEVRDKFSLRGGRPNDQDLLATARSFHTEATPIKALFIEYGMAADFLETLNANITKLEQAEAQQNTGTGGSSAARTSISTLLKRAEQEMDKLDPIVRNKYANDPATIAAWKQAIRLERAPKKK